MSQGKHTLCWLEREYRTLPVIPGQSAGSATVLQLPLAAMNQYNAMVGRTV